jgi:hypothetical protein
MRLSRIPDATVAALLGLSRRLLALRSSESGAAPDTNYASAVPVRRFEALFVSMREGGSVFRSRSEGRPQNSRLCSHLSLCREYTGPRGLLVAGLF